MEESEAKAGDYYRQVQHARETHKVLQEEYKKLSEELSSKITEVGRGERARAAQERELIELRSVKQRVGDMSAQQTKDLEERARGEVELLRCKSKITELETAVQLHRGEAEEAVEKLARKTQESERLVEQLRLFERDSFEIQSKIKRSVENEREHEQT